jgi:glyoxylase-like metal-dependent hydrolase (beta-lactamase superfamily II)
MTVQLYAMTCGFVTIPRGFLLKDAEGFITVPMPSYLIVHPKGRAVFDTGVHTDIQTDAKTYIGEMLASFHTFQFHQGDEVGARLGAAGVEPESVNFIINSHLHFDHCGGNCQLCNATIISQRREIEYARAVENTHGYLVNDWETGQDVRLIDGEYDVFGDGSVVCFPTYGHTPGHQSLRVQTERGGEFILCGDACYLKESLDNMHGPGIVADPEAVLATFRRFREMQVRGARIMFGHDPDFWKGIPQAPARLG